MVRAGASSSYAASPATAGLVSGSCSSARVFALRFFQARLTTSVISLCASLSVHVHHVVNKTFHLQAVEHARHTHKRAIDLTRSMALAQSMATASSLPFCGPGLRDSARLDSVQPTPQRFRRSLSSGQRLLCRLRVSFQLRAELLSPDPRVVHISGTVQRKVPARLVVRPVHLPESSRFLSGH